MIKPSAVANFVIRWHRPLDLIPLTSLTYLFQKAVLSPVSYSGDYEIHLHRKSYPRCIVLSAPLLLALSMPVVALSVWALGNIVIVLMDWKAKRDLIARIETRKDLYIREIIRGDRDVALAAVKRYPQVFSYISSRFRDDPVIFSAAAESAIKMFQRFNEEGRPEPEVSHLVSRGYSDLHPKLKNDPNVVAEAIRLGATVNLEFMGERIQADERLVAQIVSRDGTQLKWASESLRKNHALVLVAVQNNPEAFKMADASLQNDPVFRLQAVEANIRVLEHSPLKELVQEDEAFRTEVLNIRARMSVAQQPAAAVSTAASSATHRKEDL